MSITISENIRTNKNMEDILYIHIDSKADTGCLSAAYSDDSHVLYNPTKGEVRKALKTFTGRKVVLLGHGDINGLYNKDWNGYVIDSSLVQLLRGFEIIGIWCYATEFARRYGLHGFFTSMFISNADEATELGFNGCLGGDIEDNLRLFCERVRKLILTGFPTSIWYDYFMEQPEIEEPYVRYNYEAMEFFD